jgi:hypothetical protein
VTATRIPEKLLSAVTCVRQANDQSHNAINWVCKSVQRVHTVKTRTLISGVAEVDCAFLRKIFWGYFAANSLYLMTLCALVVSGPKLSWRLSRELFKDAVELRQRLKADRERDLANPQI